MARYTGYLQLVPVTLTEAKAFVGREHRHNAPPVGHRFSVGVADTDGRLRGVAVAGRPKARGLNQRTVLEVVRVCTDGTANACSMLYGACRRAGIAMGYDPRQIITYTLASEPGTSLHAAGWVRDSETKGKSWDCAHDRRPRPVEGSQMSGRRRCAETGCRHAPNVHTPHRGCLLCGCGQWLDTKPHKWREQVTDAWFHATHAWLIAAEASSVGYATEFAEFEEHHPRPRLGDFMRALSVGAPPELLDDLARPHPCPTCGGTGRANKRREAS